jgi:hypothetical protein
VSVGLGDDVGAATVPVRRTVTSTKDGRVVIDGEIQARLTEQHPNGASCSPMAWTATFRAYPAKGLTSTEGVALRTK